MPLTDTAGPGALLFTSRGKINGVSGRPNQLMEVLSRLIGLNHHHHPVLQHQAHDRTSSQARPACSTPNVTCGIGITWCSFIRGVYLAAGLA